MQNPLHAFIEAKRKEIADKESKPMTDTERAALEVEKLALLGYENALADQAASQRRSAERIRELFPDADV